MDRQEEYELRQKISDAIAKDVSNVMADTLRACNSNFSLEIMYPLELLERMYKRKTKAVFFANRTAKIRTLFIILQNFSEVFLFFSLSTISLFHYVNSARLSSLGKRVQKYTLFVYNPNILNSFFEVFLKEYAKVLMHNDVVEHIFLS